jgi:transcriptional regulator with XRE-family HTH domain
MKHHQLKKEVGKRMRKIRKSLGYTQNKLVSYFDIGRANYSRIEKGEIFPGAAILKTLHVTFNVSLDWLMTGRGEMFIREPGNNSKKNEETVNLGNYPEEIRELLLHMARVPMVKHAVLSFFIEYKTKNKKLIDPLLKTDKDNHS